MRSWRQEEPLRASSPPNIQCLTIVPTRRRPSDECAFTCRRLGAPEGLAGESCARLALTQWYVALSQVCDCRDSADWFHAVGQSSWKPPASHRVRRAVPLAGYDRLGREAVRELAGARAHFAL